MAKENQQTGYMGGKAMSAEDLNTSMRADIGSSYMKGPAQTSYVGMGDATKSLVGKLTNSAAANTGILNRAYDYTSGLIGQGGLTDSQRANMSMVNNLAQTSGAGNPHLDSIIKQTNDNTYADVMASLGSMGATGSSIHMNELGKALADNESRLRYDDYNQGFNRQMSAAQTGFNMGQTGTANAFGASQAAGDIYNYALMPYQAQIQAQGLLDADRQAAAQFDPNYQHLLKYQGLLSGNSANPQPAKQPGFMDYLMLGGGLLGSFL